MIRLTLVAVGNLKESYLREALAEYQKRLAAFCKPEIVQLKEYKLPDNPSQGEIKAALEEEADRILAAIPGKAYKIALCTEGKQFSSEALAEKLDGILSETGELALIIGSSHGLSERVKRTADLRLSISELTFPHQLMRVLSLEILYRSFSILKGTRYHK